MSKFVIFSLLVIAVVWFFYRSDQAKKAAAVNIAEGNAFLAGNKGQDGVQTTPSGLQYLVLEKGEGEEHPTARSNVTVHYHGTLLDGTVFDSSVERGKTISFGLNQVIPGWTEGVQLMVKGDKTRFFIPAHLAYGNRAAGKIKPGSTLIFDIELIDFK
ncbi:FKBP-type peptidyl-prolyl cis-trans isomerase [Psychrobium sp. MM17-31]|uniref:FKBP-type peptidyl-prolyl cis-trans isomerase n=1 Tax=Psychrobium sp. MM17-31 TaxID=2917758 RepID=UPI001EF3E12F|nr:FKBP-type peptidyl-prolyl cis-trans isomerase [Psychrobium sp. MM17-31]MCG7531612.1 FKBP-type peptidyl-prolyl cis-trans isomerase [Psychrobium sp. MM17-31]